MLVQEKRRRVMNDLSPLATAEPAEILKAFQIFGAFETTFYIQSFAGSHELEDIRPLYMAARKMGYPDESWEQVEAYTAQAPSFQLKNPQSEIFQPFNPNMGQAIHAVLKGTQAPEDLPDPNDRMYLNALLTTRVSAGQEYDQQTAAAERLVGYALDQSDRNPEMTVEQELRCAGLLALACRTLPDGDIFGDVSDYSLHEHLSRAHEGCVLRIKEIDQSLFAHADNTDHVAYLQEWRQKIEGVSGQLAGMQARVAEKEARGLELFAQPVKLAIQIYNHDLARKVATILKDDMPSLTPGSILRRLSGPGPS